MSPKLQALISHISGSNPKGVVKLANKNGVLPPANSQQRQEYLYHYVLEKGDKAFHDLSLLHPDRDLILGTKDVKSFSFDGYELDSPTYEPLSFVGNESSTPSSNSDNTNSNTGITITVKIEHIIILILGIALVLMWLHKKKA